MPRADVLKVRQGGLRTLSSKTLYNRWKRWSDAGVFIRMMEGLSGAQAERRTVMIDASHLKAYRTASSLRVKRGALGD